MPCTAVELGQFAHTRCGLIRRFGLGRIPSLSMTPPPFTKVVLNAAGLGLTARGRDYVLGQVLKGI